MPSTRTTTIATAALLALVASACGSTTTSNADNAAAGGTSSPTIDSFDVIATSTGATLIASINDPDGDIAAATIDWGDGAVEQVSAGFPGLRLDHGYATPGVYAVSLQAVDAVGNATSTAGSADIGALTSTTTTPPTTIDTTTTTTTTTTTPPVTAPPTTAPPRIDPPRTDPPRTTTTTTTPPPAPEPVTLDLRNSLLWTVDGTAPDGAGGSGEAKKVGSNGAAFRSSAWHGYNGSGNAEVEATFDQDWSSVLDAFEEDYGTTLARVDISWEVSGNGRLKAPWDRSASVWGSVEVGGGLGDVDDSTEIADHGFEFGHEQDEPFGVSISSSGYTSTYIDAADTDLFFELEIECGTRSGGKAFALLNEGWCDFFEGGGIVIDRLDVTLTPLPGYEFADGTVVEIG